MIQINLEHDKITRNWSISTQISYSCRNEAKWGTLNPPNLLGLIAFNLNHRCWRGLENASDYATISFIKLNFLSNWIVLNPSYFSLVYTTKKSTFWNKLHRCNVIWWYDGYVFSQSVVDDGLAPKIINNHSPNKLYLYLTLTLTEIYSWTHYLEAFLYFVITSPQRKRNGTRLIWPESEWTSCLTSY